VCIIASSSNRVGSGMQDSACSNHVGWGMQDSMSDRLIAEGKYDYKSAVNAKHLKVAGSMSQLMVAALQV
jgi:hypothetical protein